MLPLRWTAHMDGTVGIFLIDYSSQDLVHQSQDLLDVESLTA